MRHQKSFIRRVLDLLVEIVVRVTLKVICVLTGFVIAGRIAGWLPMAGWLKGVITLLAAIGTFVALQPVFYRLYPQLKRSDAQRRMHPDPRALIIAGLLVALLAAFGEDAWYGVILISLVALGCIFALFMRLLA